MRSKNYWLTNELMTSFSSQVGIQIQRFLFSTIKNPFNSIYPLKSCFCIVSKVVDNSGKNCYLTVSLWSYCSVVCADFEPIKTFLQAKNLLQKNEGYCWRSLQFPTNFDCLKWVWIMKNWIFRAWTSANSKYNACNLKSDNLLGLLCGHITETTIQIMNVIYRVER